MPTITLGDALGDSEGLDKLDISVVGKEPGQRATPGFGTRQRIDKS
jgi:hypothetical protein